jgi:integrase
MARPINHEPPPLPEHAEAWLDGYLGRGPGGRSKTFASYATSLRKLQAFAQATRLTGKGIPLPVRAIKPSILGDFFDWMQRQPALSNSALRLYLAAAKRFLSWMAGKGLIEPELLQKILAQFHLVTGRGHQRLKPAVRGSDSDLLEVLEYWRGRAIPGGTTPAQKRARLRVLRDRALLLTLYATAGRAAEVQQLKRRDADREYVSVIGKRSKPRELFLTPEARHALKAYLAARGHDGNDALFVGHHPNGRSSRVPLATETMWAIVQRAAREAVGEERGRQFGPHAFRHLRAQRLLDSGKVPIEDLQAILGHESILITRKIYAPKTPRAKLQRAIAAADASEPESEEPA